MTKTRQSSEYPSIIPTSSRGKWLSLVSEPDALGGFTLNQFNNAELKPETAAFPELDILTCHLPPRSPPPRIPAPARRSVVEKYSSCSLKAQQRWEWREK